jgi:hypothetical protein
MSSSLFRLQMTVPSITLLTKSQTQLNAASCFDMFTYVTSVHSDELSSMGGEQVFMEKVYRSSWRMKDQLDVTCYFI